MPSKFKCYFLENTGRMTPFIDGVSSPIFKRPDTGEELTINEALPGAMWYATHMIRPNGTDLSSLGPGPDGKHLYVKLPNGRSWFVDGEASNCTRKGDKTHKCWIRHGDPTTGNIHVDKKGDTCDAGGGSIASDEYHGWLHDGYLVEG